MKRFFDVVLFSLVISLFAFSGCTNNQNSEKTTESSSIVSDEKTGYTIIDQETAKEMMTRDDGHIILDVRRKDEYDAGHIPDAILIPNESIGSEKPEQLPDTEQIILIYCRSGNRSKQAATKLSDLGYKNLYEFGGINTWTGEIVTEE